VQHNTPQDTAGDHQLPYVPCEPIVCTISIFDNHTRMNVCVSLYGMFIRIRFVKTLVMCLLTHDQLGFWLEGLHFEGARFRGLAIRVAEGGCGPMGAQWGLFVRKIPASHVSFTFNVTFRHVHQLDLIRRRIKTSMLQQYYGTDTRDTKYRLSRA
jgi:hypothetical protein